MVSGSAFTSWCQCIYFKYAVHKPVGWGKAVPTKLYVLPSQETVSLMSVQVKHHRDHPYFIYKCMCMACLPLHWLFIASSSFIGQFWMSMDFSYTYQRHHGNFFLYPLLATGDPICWVLQEICGHQWLWLCCLDLPSWSVRAWKN